MFYFLFLFIYLAIVSFGVVELRITCQPGVTDQDVIHVIQARNINNGSNIGSIDKHKLDNVLYDKCKEFYHMILPEYDLDHSVNATEFNIGSGLNFINLFASNSKFNKDDERIVYAGDVYDKKRLETSVYSNNTYSVHVPNFNNSLNYDCKNRSKNLYDKHWTETKVNVVDVAIKIMSKKLSEINYGDLFDFITKLHYDNGEIKSRESCRPYNTAVLNTVLVCGDATHCPDRHMCSEIRRCMRDGNPNSATLKVKASFETCKDEIKNLKDKLLAVIAPAPFELDSEFIIPTVFYEASYMDNELETQFPNSISLINGDLLKHGFIKFIKDMGWRRIAIISDDTAFSEEFEKEMLIFFNDERILHNVQRCERHCNFPKALNTLSKMKARIIIINMNEANARKVSAAAFNYDFTLLYRVSPHAISVFGPRESFFITLDIANVGTPCKCPGIVNGLQVIDYAHSNFQYDKKLKRKVFFRDFTTNMNKFSQDGATAYVMSKEKGSRPVVLSVMDINNSGHVNIVTKKQITNTPMDESQICIMKTSKFEKPCDIFLIVYFMFVILVFMILVLVITCYFHSTSPIHAVAYTQF